MASSSTKRVTVADLADRFDQFLALQETILGRLDAQRDGLVAAESRIEDMAVKVYAPPVVEPTCQHLHYSNGRDDCTAFCVCVEGGPVTDCDHTTVSLLPSRVLRQEEINPDELGFSVEIEDLMDGGNVAATEALDGGTPEFDPVRDVQIENMTNTDEIDVEQIEAAFKLAALGIPDLGDTSTEQAILRIATRMFYLQMGEDIMDSQGDRRSGYVAEAWDTEANALFPLLYQWVRERGWV